MKKLSPSSRFFMRRNILLLPLLLSTIGFTASPALSQTAAVVAPAAPGRLVVVYRNGAIPADADAIIASAGAHRVLRLARFGMASVQVAPGTEAAVATRLRSHAEVAAVLRDHFVAAHMMMPLRTSLAIALGPNSIPPTPNRATPNFVSAPYSPGLGHITAPNIFGHAGDAGAAPAPLVTYDTSYDSPAGWAVLAAGGYGDNLPGGPATGPWNTSLGAGVRIAVLDSGVDATHPDIAPNLVFNLSDVDQSAATGEPSPCDDGSPQDQQGHGTYVASLALGAIHGGETIGVAPQASLLNIKVLERLPSAIGATLAAQCESGQAGGLLSWVLQGIEDAVAQHADVISLSLGSIVDLSTGDGAGWKAQFDAVTYAAAQAGTLIVAAAGNDGLNLSGGRYVELPAQARGVLAVTASTNPACSENLTAGATCAPGPATRPYYSNYGSTLNAIAAPGGSYPEGPDTDPATGPSGYIRGACSSGLPNTTDGLPTTPNQSLGCFGLGHTAYVQAMGTSASTGLVAGAAAILRAAHPTWTPAQIIAALQTSATTIPSMAEPQLNLAGALSVE
jgi:subtilisin family serine protease